ncbi:TPA: TRASH domain-containing protein [Salmonella enterica subsp. enterica serovar Bovismorbificans]
MSFIQTLSGKQFDYLSATIDDIDIEDIAVALSNKGYETCCPECNHEFKTDFVY